MDPATGKPRGFMRMGLQPRLDSVLFTLDVRDASWHAARDFLERRLRRVVAAAAAAAPGAAAAGVLRVAAEAAPHDALRRFVARRAIDLFLRELRAMPLHAAIQPGVPPASPVDISGSNCWSVEQGLQQVEAPEPAAPPGQCVLQRANEAAAGEACCQAEAAAAPAADTATGTAAESAATSRHATLASSAEPAVKEDLAVERACMLLLLAPRDVWREIPDPQLREEVLAMLDTSRQQVVAIEAEYLASQYFELPIIEAAMAAAEEARAHAACAALPGACDSEAHRAGQAAAGGGDGNSGGSGGPSGSRWGSSDADRGGGNGWDGVNRAAMHAVR
eukprot:scaffold2.g6936.t1